MPQTSRSGQTMYPKAKYLSATLSTKHPLVQFIWLSALTTVQKNIIADSKCKRLTTVSVNQPDLYSEDASRILMRQMLGAFFQYEKTLLVAKRKKGARVWTKAATGSCEGRKPYRGRPGEANVIQQIVTLRQAGKVIDTIADALNLYADGVRPRSGGKWYLWQRAGP